MAERIRTHDWAATPVGSIEGWPQSMHVAVRLILGSRQPMFLWWGPAWTRIYNDACIAILGPERHPHVLGSSAQGEKSTLWAVIGPQIEQVLAGGKATWHENGIVPVFRDGRWQDARWDYGFSPIDEPTAPNGVGGVLAICREVTQEHAQREALRESQACLQAAVELVGLCPYSVDMATGTRIWDNRLRKIWGLPPGAHVDRQVFLSAIHPSDRPRVEAALEAGSNPRSDGVYHLEYRVIGIGDGVERWVSAHGQTAFKEGRPVTFVGAALDITDRKRADARLRASEERLTLLVAELQHRTRNLLAVVKSLSSRSLSQSKSLDDFAERFEARLDALSRANGLLSRLHKDDRITFDALVRMELSAHGAFDAEGLCHQIQLSGPEGVQLRSSTVQTLALGLHELATNALKHGALSQPQGRLRVDWRLLNREGREPLLVIEWEESGVSIKTGPGSQPDRRGYGRELIECALPYQLQAEVSYNLRPGGLRCAITLPATSGAD
ncbi:sensor histidine kinase [Muricoccus vinaceus]|uniref:histidine kinase n=1 Tax=Muricoccus vinaceus TaxID=424704 RepID=A0ABV6IVP0_9PROT